MEIFLDGAIAMGCVVAGLFFLRFWRQSRERLFLAFSLAFWVFAINYAMLGMIPLANERRPYVFLLRLIGFFMILWGIVQNNRRGNSRP